jgi:hypothetical protein
LDVKFVGFFSFRECVVCCGHACARGSVLEIGDAGYELGVVKDKFYAYVSILKFTITPFYILLRI